MQFELHIILFCFVIAKQKSNINAFMYLAKWKCVGGVSLVKIFVQ